MTDTERLDWYFTQRGWRIFDDYESPGEYVVNYRSWACDDDMHHYTGGFQSYREAIDYAMSFVTKESWAREYDPCIRVTTGENLCRPEVHDEITGNLERLAEPTEEMIDAGMNELSGFDPDWCSTTETVRRIYVAMEGRREPPK